MRPSLAALLSAIAMSDTASAPVPQPAADDSATPPPAKSPGSRFHLPAGLGWTVGTADSMTNVQRAPTPQRRGLAVDTPRISLARNEFEGIQVVATAGSVNITGLRWEASSPAAGTGLELSLRPIGYVHAGLSEGCPFNVTANPLCTGSMPVDCGDGVCRKYMSTPHHNLISRIL